MTYRIIKHLITHLNVQYTKKYSPSDVSRLVLLHILQSVLTLDDEL